MNMEGDRRREEIVRVLKESKEAVTGTWLAQQFGVSRQVIVQDVALLRVAHEDIISTNKGYLLVGEKRMGQIRRVIQVKHKEEDILDELFTIVDFGGHVIDVFVEHGVYGRIQVPLLVKSREDAIEFVRSVKAKESKPLTDLTGGIHFHTVETEREESFLQIVRQLEQKGYLRKI